MTLQTQAYEVLVSNFSAWAETQDNIRTAFIIGSRARSDHPADEWADLDIVIFAKDPRPYMEDADWVENIGVPWVTFLEPTADGRGWERRVLFEGGLDVDFAFEPLELAQKLVSEGVPPDVADPFRRGFRVLLDRDDLIGRLNLEDQDALPLQPPTERTFLNAVNDFWYHTVWTAKHLRRGELWWAKESCDIYMKELLRRMLKWHAQATRPGTDTWLRGRFLEEWADPRAVGELRRAFAHYDVEDVWRALLASMDLFRWLSQETAQKWKFTYPSFGADRATELTRSLFEDRLSSMAS